MPIASGPATPPSTAPTSPTSLTGTNDYIDCEKGSIDEEVIEECDEKGSQHSSPEIPSRHRQHDGRLKLVQRSKDLNDTQSDHLLNVR